MGRSKLTLRPSSRPYFDPVSQSDVSRRPVCCFVISPQQQTRKLKLEPVRFAIDQLWNASLLLPGVEMNAELGVDVEVKPSAGAGLGIYALRTIKAGELLGRY